MKLLQITAVATMLASASFAQTAAPAATGPITVSDAYARSTNPKVGAAFMTLTNSGAAECVLRDVKTDVAEKAELHTHKETDGVMKMVQVTEISVPAGQTHALARGGDHVMLMGTKVPLKDGDEVALTLDFGDCGTVPLNVKVENSRKDADGMPAMDHSKMGHGTEVKKP